MNVVKLLTDTAKKFPDKPAIIFAEDSISFSRLKDLCFCFANGLKRMGLSKGTKIAIYLPNCPEYIISYFAVYSMGGIIVPLDFMLVQAELENLINHSEAKVLITKEKRDIDLKRLK